MVTGDEARQTYLSLAVRRVSPRPIRNLRASLRCRSTPRSPRRRERAWFIEAAGQVRSMRMWWSRPWWRRLVHHGVLVRRAAGPRHGCQRRPAATGRSGSDPGPTDTSDAPYVIGDPALRLVASQDAGVYDPGRVWRWRGHEITLLTIGRTPSHPGSRTLLTLGVTEQ